MRLDSGMKGFDWLNIINGEGIKTLNLSVKCNSVMLLTLDVCLRGVCMYECA